MQSAQTERNPERTPERRFRQIPFWKLRARFRECGFFDEDVAHLAEIADATFGRRMRGLAPWTTAEIVRICRVVDITPEEIGLYFCPELADENKSAPAV